MSLKQGKPITDNLSQLIVVTGPRGVGKTVFAATFLKPGEIDKMVYVDSENSANNFRRGLFALGKDFGQYINTMEQFKGLPSDNDLLDRISKGDVPWVSKFEQSLFIDYFQHFLSQIKEIPHGKYKALVIDTGERLEAGMAAYVEANKRKFGIIDTSYGKLWVNGVYPLYSYLLQGIWDRGIDTVILTFHLKNVWEGKRPVPGKVTHAGKKLLYYLSSLMIWLVNEPRNPNGEPAGLVLKERMGKIGTTGDEWNIRTMIPARIPVCTWKEIAGYLSKGYDLSHPKPTEIPSDHEKEMISELLTDIQIRLMLEDMQLEREERAVQMAEAGILPTTKQETIAISEESETPRNKSEAITKWKTLGRPVPELLKKLREKGIGDDQIASQWNEIASEE